MPPKLKRVVRLDSLPLTQAYFTDEGYLVDRPILTSTGIFEYTNNDGTIRRELRTPEEVFAEESLKSYKGKPIIITHDAGLITKDNVHDESVGTILSEGYKDGDDVRAEIIIHDTDEMKAAGLKELSLGYNLELDETPGIWKGQPYDAVQRNITINHLALVLEARAGEQARLNIDNRERKSKGATHMNRKKAQKSRTRKPQKRTRRADGVLTPEELEAAIESYKARRAQRLAEKADEEEKVISAEPPVEDEDDVVTAPDVEQADTDDTEEKLQMVKDRRDHRDEEGDPETTEEAMGVIAQQDDDMDILFDIIDTLIAERDFAKDDEEETIVAEDDEDDVAEDEDDEEIPVTDDEDDDEFAGDEDDNEFSEDDDEEEFAEDDDDDDIPTTNESGIGKSVTNIDSIDRIVRERIQLGMVGRALHMDGLENMKLMKAKKTVIRAVRPGMRLDGKSKAYIDAAFDCAVNDVLKSKRKDTKYQKRQMFNKDSRSSRYNGYAQSSQAARQRMIKRQMNHKKEAK